MIDMLSEGLSQIQSLMLFGISVAASAYIASVWWRTRALVPTLSAIALSAVVVWAASNVTSLSDQVNEDSLDWIGQASAATEARS